MIPGIYWIPIAVFVGLTTALVVKTIECADAKQKTAEVQAAWNADKAQAATAAQKAEADARLEEQRRNKAREDIENEAQAKLKAANDAAVAANTAAMQLRKRIDVLVAGTRKAPGNSPVIPSGPTADDTTGMLTDVLGRCIARVQLLASVADERGAAGTTCEAEHDSLMPAP